MFTEIRVTVSDRRYYLDTLNRRNMSLDIRAFSRHNRENHWCRFPRMKCACMDTNSYERLPTMAGFMALSALRAGATAEDKDSSTEKQEELLFYNDDGSFQSVVVERNLCATDLCQLLALKNRVSKDVNWTIIEHWIELGLERILEDHEDVLSAHRDMENYSRYAETRFIFRKDFRKYEFFHNPEQFFPSDMIDLELENCERILYGGVYSAAATLRNMILVEGQCPSVFSRVWVLDPEKQMWAKGFLLLRDKKLYLSYRLSVVAKFMRSGKVRDSTYFPVSEAEANQLTVLALLSDFHVYSALNAKNQFRAPTEWGICLRPSGVDSEPTADLDDDVDFAGPSDSNAGLCCLSCDSERARTCWLTAMRLAKYGKQLRENYRAFKNKQVESINPKEYNSYTVPNESVRSRVAMDFTGSVGRIVEDPKEAKAIAAAEGYSWRRRWRPSTRTTASAQSPVPQGIESGVHITQPWFHSGMSRDQAATLVTRYGTVDGVFLVRDSRSNPGAFVLTYKCGGKVLHTQITPILDPVREAHVFSLDNGFTKFYDLLQLVEFYQLNAGVLPTRLTHYVVQSPTGISVPAPIVAPSVAGSF